MDLFMALRDEGFDVPSLEQYYCKVRHPERVLSHVQDAETIQSLVGPHP